MTVKEREKKEFSTQNNLGMLQRCKFKTGTTLDIKHTNPMPTKDFQDAFRHLKLDH